MHANLVELEKKLWSAADELRANSELKSSEYSVPVLGLIFLRYADVKFAHAQQELGSKSTGRRTIGKTDFHAKGVLYLPEGARYAELLQVPEGEDIGAKLNEAMKLVEQENEELKGVLPKTYQKVGNDALFTLLKTFASIPLDIEGDAFGKIYEYFLGEFAKAEGQKGGEFFTPTALVKLIVEIIEPFHGKIYDPACGSGGMFVQSANFVAEHRRNPGSEISVYGEERVAETVRLCKMNLAVHGLSGDIRQGNSYYEDIHEGLGKFDFVMANPPFNVNGIDKERIKDDRRFPFGMPKTDNGNTVWIQMFYSTLSERGRAGFVMANSASDARASELEIRRQLIQAKAVDVMVAIGSNFFYTVALPCTLWFLDKGKRGTDREDTILFIDARNIFRQIDRAHRDFTPAQIELLANIARLYRGEEIETAHGSAKLLKEKFPEGLYSDVPGLCKVATLKEIEGKDWSLSPGRYVEVPQGQGVEDFDFQFKLEELAEEFENLNAESHELEQAISEECFNVARWGSRMIRWENKVLGKIADFTNGGAWNQSEYSDSGVPVVRVSDVQNETVSLTNCKYLSEASFEKYRKHLLLTGDLIVCTVGSHPTQPGSVVGRPGIVPKAANGALLNQNAVRIRPSSKEIDRRWLGYIGRSPFFRNYIISHARGSANQVRMAIGLLKQMPVSVPPLETQRKIATILSAYDDLIENNNRRIKILQEMAQTIYQEWFVNFRFPGHEKIKMVDSTLGKIPEGWEVKSLLELAIVKYGKNLPRKNLVENGPYPVYGAAKIIGRYTEYSREQRTIVCGCRGSVGEMQITEPKCFVTNNSFTFDPIHADNFFWLYQTLKHRGLQDVVGGAAQPQITLEGISSVESAVPALSLRTQYQQAVSPIYELTWRLGSKTENLRQTRDLLLPKLISGAIDVSGIQIGADTN